MQITGQQQVGAPRDTVWSALNDPEILRRAIPGCQSLERQGDGFAAVVSVKIGPIGARFNGSVTIENPEPPQGYTLVGQGQGGMAGSAKGSAQVTLADQGQSTLLTYTVDAEVGGRLAQLGGPVIDATAKQLAAKFFANFEREVTGGTASGAATPASAAQGGTAFAAAPAATPWPWLAALAVAVIAGYFLGRSGADYLWVVAAIALAVTCGMAGFATGRGGHR